MAKYKLVSHISRCGLLLCGALILYYTLCTPARVTYILSSSGSTARCYQKPTGIEKVDRFFRKLNEQLAQASKNLARAQGKHCIILIGDTGVGKSTLGNAIKHGSHTIREVIRQEGDGCFMRRSEYLVPTKEIVEDDAVLSSVGGGDESVTQFPQVITLTSSAVLCDCPGFEDTEGGEKELINCIVLGQLLRNARSVSIYFLMTENDLVKQDRTTLRAQKIIHTLQNILQQEHDGEPISLSSIAKVSFLVTKLSGQQWIGNLRCNMLDLLAKIFPNKSELELKAVVRDNLYFVDAKDRAILFKGSPYSKQHTTIAELRAIMLASYISKSYAPEAFCLPVTRMAAEGLDNLCTHVQQRAYEAIMCDASMQATKQAIQPMMRALYQLMSIGLPVDNYITSIHNALEQKQQGIDQAIIIQELQKQLAVAKHVVQEEMGGFAMAGRGIDQMISGAKKVAVGAAKGLYNYFFG